MSKVRGPASDCFSAFTPPRSNFPTLYRRFNFLGGSTENEFFNKLLMRCPINKWQ
jgi:hypothetical protein